MSERDDLQRTAEALERATEQLREFSASFLPKLAAAGAGDEGDSVLASQMVKQFAGYVFRVFPAEKPRRALKETFETLAAQMREGSVG